MFSCNQRASTFGRPPLHFRHISYVYRTCPLTTPSHPRCLSDFSRNMMAEVHISDSDVYSSLSSIPGSCRGNYWFNIMELALVSDIPIATLRELVSNKPKTWAHWSSLRIKVEKTRSGGRLGQAKVRDSPPRARTTHACAGSLLWRLRYGRKRGASSLSTGETHPIPPSLHRFEL